MKVITYSNGVVIYIGPVAEIVENGIDVGQSILGEQGLSIYDVPDVDMVGKEVLKFLYNGVDGFTANPNYQPPVPPDTDRINALQTALDQTNATLAKKNEELEQLTRDMAEQTNAILDLFNIILGGV